MESLESKLDRLSPDQRKETEDFVDFLLSRSGQVCSPPDPSRNPPPVMDVAPLPISLIEPIRTGESRPVRLQGITHAGDQAGTESGNDTAPFPFQEIGDGIQDRITHDYMDYGQFESHPTPAAEAVKKVKRKLIAREGQDRPHHLLDWVD